MKIENKLKCFSNRKIGFQFALYNTVILAKEVRA